LLESLEHVLAVLFYGSNDILIFNLNDFIFPLPPPIPNLYGTLLKSLISAAQLAVVLPILCEVAVCGLEALSVDEMVAVKLEEGVFRLVVMGMIAEGAKDASVIVGPVYVVLKDLFSVVEGDVIHY
jgi:hypothetical protein